MALIRTSQSLEQRIHSPSVKPPGGPVCMTCGRTVDSESLVEGMPGQTTYAKVLVKHHGAEELRRFDMGSVEWDDYELASHMRRANWFDPTAHEGLGLGVKMKPLDGGVVNPELDERKIISIGADAPRPLGRVPGRLVKPDGGG